MSWLAQDVPICTSSRSNGTCCCLFRYDQSRMVMDVGLESERLCSPLAWISHAPRHTSTHLVVERSFNWARAHLRPPRRRSPLPPAPLVDSKDRAFSNGPNGPRRIRGGRRESGPPVDRPFCWDPNPGLEGRSEPERSHGEPNLDVLGPVVAEARRGTSGLRGTVLERGAPRCIDPRGNARKGYLLRVEGRKTWQGTPSQSEGAERVRDGIGFWWPNARRKHYNVRFAIHRPATSMVKLQIGYRIRGGARKVPVSGAGRDACGERVRTPDDDGGSQKLVLAGLPEPSLNSSLTGSCSRH